MPSPFSERCRNAKLPVDENVVYLAILFHDAGYGEDHGKKGFPHKEAHAAHIAAHELRKNGFDERLIEKVKAAVLGTHRDAILNSVEQKVVRAADLSNIASDYEVFRKDAENLRKEHKLMTGTTLNEVDWKKMIQSQVEFYLSQMINITSSPSMHTSEFHIRAKQNLDRFLTEE